MGWNHLGDSPHVGLLDDVITWDVSWAGFVLWSALIGSHCVWECPCIVMVIHIHNGSLWDGHGINSAKLISHVMHLRTGWGS